MYGSTVTNRRGDDMFEMPIGGVPVDEIENRRFFVKHFTAIVIGAILYIVVALTLVFSIKFVNYNQYAFPHNIFTSVDTSTVITPGTYLYPPWVNLEYFPSTYQYVTLYEPVFSETGLEFDLEINFFYRLKKEKLSHIYNVFSKSYHDKILYNAKQIIKNTGNKYKVDDYVVNRHIVEADIGQSLTKELDRDIGVEIAPDLVKITSIHFPENVVSTNLMSALAQQHNEVEMNKQHYAAVMAATNVMVSQLDAEAEQVLQYSVNEGNLKISIADSLSKGKVMDAKSKGMESFFETLKITDAETKLKFINMFGIIENVNTTLTKGFDSNNIFLSK